MSPILWLLRRTPKWRGTDLTYTTRKEGSDHWRTYAWTDRDTGKRNSVSANRAFSSLRLLHTIDWKGFGQAFAEPIPECDRQWIANRLPLGAKIRFEDRWYVPSGQPRTEEP